MKGKRREIVKKSNRLRWKTGIRAANITLDEITILINRKRKPSICKWLAKPATTVPAILLTKKAKAAYNILHKKSLLPAYL